jgi:non-heme chloroperoxidase
MRSCERECAIRAHTNFEGDSTMHFIDTTDDVSLFYQELGSGAPVVFLHGTPLNSEFWESQTNHLAENGYRCIAFDRRGHGKSTRASSGYDFDTLADDLAAVMETLDLHRAILVGHSVGTGEIARYLCRHGTERVAGVVLVGGILPTVRKGPDAPDLFPPEFFKAVEEGIVNDRAAYYASLAPGFFGAHGSREMSDWILSMALQTSMRAHLECNRSQAVEDFTADLASMSVPTLIVHGDADFAQPVELTAARAHAAIPSSRLLVYEGAPHALPLTHRARLNDDLLAFARNVSSAEAAVDMAGA